MNRMEENIFVVGPQAAGRSFIGRLDEVHDLESIFTSVAAIHLVGPPRIGKSSLVRRVFEQNEGCLNRISVWINMGECEHAYDFWTTFSSLIKEQIRDEGLWNDRFERNYHAMDSVSLLETDWFTRFKTQLKSVLKQLRRMNYRLVLAIDEFDSVNKVFGQAPHYFQMLRSIYSEPDYVTSGVIVSRRGLHLLEAESKDISTYHGVFREKTLIAFNRRDMETFYNALGAYGIRLLSGGRERFEHYTGRIPYLCCMFAERMVGGYKDGGMLDDKEVEDVFKACLPQVERYYEDLISRLEYDGYLESVFYLSIPLKFPTQSIERDISNLVAMGVLLLDGKDGVGSYYVYSEDFMMYFKLCPPKLPDLEKITLSEKKIKAIFGKEFPELDEITYNDMLLDDSLIQRFNTEYPEFGLNSDKIKQFCADLAAHKANPTLLDVLALPEVVKVIVDNWPTRFRRYFGGDESWKEKLECIREMRKPAGHASAEYITQESFVLCMRYCDEIIHM